MPCPSRLASAVGVGPSERGRRPVSHVGCRVRRRDIDLDEDARRVGAAQGVGHRAGDRRAVGLRVRGDVLARPGTTRTSDAGGAVKSTVTALRLQPSRVGAVIVRRGRDDRRRRRHSGSPPTVTSARAVRARHLPSRPGRARRLARRRPRGCADAGQVERSSRRRRGDRYAVAEPPAVSDRPRHRPGRSSSMTRGQRRGRRTTGVELLDDAAVAVGAVLSGGTVRAKVVARCTRRCVHAFSVTVNDPIAVISWSIVARCLPSSPTSTIAMPLSITEPSAAGDREGTGDGGGGIHPFDQRGAQQAVADLQVDVVARSRPRSGPGRARRRCCPRALSVATFPPASTTCRIHRNGRRCRAARTST